ncbi:MAG TPA: GntR family transcriptional regulator [Casimicrobiaceae bacterium]|nr:GntR family transcriptional regulator [Casimicrobiaceae bacterium]
MGQAVRPLKLREQAYSSFTERLLASAIQPGQFVTQRELVEITGMPLGAIRELVPRLEAEGLVTTVPQRGMRIAAVNLNLIRDAFQFRLFLEREAAAYFVQHVPDDELRRLRAAHEAVLQEAARRITPRLVARAQAIDWNLHDTIIDFLQNDIVSSAYRVNSIKIRLIRQAQTRIHESLVVPVMREHLGVIAAFETRDPAKAADAIGAHIANARGRAMRL